jgi:hypothetical protein
VIFRQLLNTDAYCAAYVVELAVATVSADRVLVF